MELADVLEEFDDGGIRYCDHVKHGSESGDLEMVHYVTVDTAIALGYPDLARSLEEALQRLERFEVPAPAHTHQKHGSFVPPLSHKLDSRIALKQCWQRWTQIFSR